MISCKLDDTNRSIRMSWVSFPRAAQVNLGRFKISCFLPEHVLLVCCFYLQRPKTTSVSGPRPNNWFHWNDRLTLGCVFILSLCMSSLWGVPHDVSSGDVLYLHHLTLGDVSLQSLMGALYCFVCPFVTRILGREPSSHRHMTPHDSTITVSLLSFLCNNVQ